MLRKINLNKRANLFYFGSAFFSRAFKPGKTLFFPRLWWIWSPSSWSTQSSSRRRKSSKILGRNRCFQTPARKNQTFTSIHILWWTSFCHRSSPLWSLVCWHNQSLILFFFFKIHNFFFIRTSWHVMLHRRAIMLRESLAGIVMVSPSNMKSTKNTVSELEMMS